MNKWLEIILGLILIIGAILIWYYTLDKGIWNFGAAAWTVLKGSLMWILLLIGLLFIILGINDLKE